MRNLILTIGLCFCLLITGCIGNFQKVNRSENIDKGKNPDNLTNKSDNINNIEGVERIPNISDGENKSNVETDIGNINTTKLNVKRVVINKINPGTCFGMPTIHPKEWKEEKIRENQKIADYIRVRCNINETNNIFEKIQQYNQISILRKTDADTFRVQIRDGNCCIIRTMNASVNIESETVKVLNKSTENVPC